MDTEKLPLPDVPEYETPHAMTPAMRAEVSAATKDILLRAAMKVSADLALHMQTSQDPVAMMRFVEMVKKNFDQEERAAGPSLATVNISFGASITGTPVTINVDSQEKMAEEAEYKELRDMINTNQATLAKPSPTEFLSKIRS